MTAPREILLEGARILQPQLQPWGFEFHFLEEGAGSGGQFASGAFSNLNRTLELHLRHSLGLVTYSVDEIQASHETYMRELGVWNQCHYPGFSSDTLHAFAALAHDLQYAEDFLSGTAEVLRRAAINQAVANAQSAKAEMASAVGDTAQLGELHTAFYAREYDRVIEIASALKFPERLSNTQQTMIQVARDRSNRVRGNNISKPTKSLGRK